MSAQTTAAIVAQISDGPAEPTAFDPAHPDAEIHESFARYRQLKVWAYRQEDLNEAIWPEGDDDLVDDAVARFENEVLGNYPTSPISAALQLMLVIPRTDMARELDRDLVEVGVLPFGSNPQSLAIDWSAERLLGLAYALFDMEWGQARDAYERSETDFNLALELVGLVEAERARSSGRSSPFVDAVESFAKKIEDRFSNSRQVERLLRTPPPTWADYQIKAGIAIAEGMAAEAAPWLARDVNLLNGATTVPAKTKGA